MAGPPNTDFIGGLGLELWLQNPHSLVQGDIHHFFNIFDIKF